jgi:hypothetical protein
MVARANSIVVRGDLANLNCYYLLGDSSMKGYMWTTLVDAMDEFDGRILPLKSLLVRP